MMARRSYNATERFENWLIYGAIIFITVIVGFAVYYMLTR
jgi:hypothetical protein